MKCLTGLPVINVAIIITTMNKFYQRQITLPFVGLAGQEKITKSKVLIIGAGGLGHPCALYLAGSGVGTLGILDFDKVDYSNLHRQIVFTPNDIESSKAEILANNISKQNPNIQVNCHNEYLDALNIERLFKNYEIILDCCDNLSTKFLIHDTCFKLQKTLVQGSIDQIEGELKVFDFFNDHEKSPCLRCLWGKVPENDCVDSCAEAGVLPTTAGVFGTLMANEVLKIILQTSHLKNGESFLFNLFSLESRIIKWKKNLTCPLCSQQEKLCGREDSFELSHHKINNLADYQVIDLRTALLFTDEVEAGKKYLLVCEKGVTSLTHTKILRENGHTNIWSLSGGAKCLSFIK